jgi:hypothetical protein
MRPIACLIAAATLVGTIPGACAQTDLVKALDARFVPTKFTADKGTVVTQGTVVALRNDGLLVYSVTVQVAPVSVLKKDKLTQGFGDMLSVDMADGLGRPGGSATIPRKRLVAGEKLSVRAIELAKDGILVQVVTDAYDDGRYFGTLKFPIPKGSVPTPDEAVKAVSEVLEIQPTQDQSGQQVAASGPPPAPVQVEVSPPQPAPQTQYQDIAPPPPPPAPAATVSIGEPKNQVASDFGEPQRKAVVGTKEFFFYPDLKMKITFTNGKVSNVE